MIHAGDGRGFGEIVSSVGTAAFLTLSAILAPATAARAQYVQIQAVEVTPFVGARFGGIFDIQTDQPSPIQATLKDASSYGFSAGVRFDDFSLVEFRWTRSTSALRFSPPLQNLGASLGDVTLNQFHADFTRFSFGFGAGLKQFLGPRLGIRAEANWLPILIEPEVGAWACGTVGVGGCLVVLNGRLTQQFEMSIGPVVRF